MLDEEAIHDLIGRTYDAAIGEEESWQTILDDIRVKIGAGSAAFLVCDPTAGASALTLFSNVDASLGRKIEEYYHKVDPWLHRALEMKTLPGVFTDEILMPKHEYMETEMYRDLCRLYDIGQGTFAAIKNTNSMLSTMSFFRSAHADSFDARSKAFLTALQPHLKRSLHLYRTFTPLRGNGVLFESMFHALPFAAFMLDPYGRVLEVNDRAKALLRSSPVLGYVQRRLEARPLENNDLLSKALRQLRPGLLSCPEMDQDFVFLKAPRNEDSLRLAIAPMKARSRPSFSRLPGSELSGILVIATPLAHAVPSLDVLRSEFKLTDSEAEVAQCLCRGFTADQIAKHRDTTLGTVRVQIRSLREKTLCHSIAELLANFLQYSTK